MVLLEGVNKAPSDALFEPLSYSSGDEDIQEPSWAAEPFADAHVESNYLRSEIFFEVWCAMAPKKNEQGVPFYEEHPFISRFVTLLHGAIGLVVTIGAVASHAFHLLFSDDQTQNIAADYRNALWTGTKYSFRAVWSPKDILNEVRASFHTLTPHIGNESSVFWRGTSVESVGSIDSSDFNALSIS